MPCHQFSRTLGIKRRAKMCFYERIVQYFASVTHLPGITLLLPVKNRLLGYANSYMGTGLYLMTFPENFHKSPLNTEKRDISYLLKREGRGWLDFHLLSLSHSLHGQLKWFHFFIDLSRILPFFPVQDQLYAVFSGNLCAMNVYVQRVNIAYNSYFFLSS
jgi:hypothetical protein